MTKTPRNPPRHVATAAARATTAPRRVEIVAFPQVQLLDVSGPLQVFASANDHALERGAPAPYRIALRSTDAQVQTSSGVVLMAAPLPRRGPPPDTLLVAGGQGVAQAVRDTGLLRWLTVRAAQARRVGSVCTGAFVLGAAGLLDGRRAVTHWQACEQLQRRFPLARVEHDPIFVRDGSLWTSAGVTAGIDLALAMVQDDLGHAAAMAVARDLVVFLKRPGSQAQFSSALANQQGSAEFDALHAWMASHLAADLSVAALAARCGMSERSFVRRYRAATGATPATAVQRLRTEAARQLLATTRWPIKRLAQRCGFGSEETLRRCLQRQAQTTPRDYRARFSAA